MHNSVSSALTQPNNFAIGTALDSSDLESDTELLPDTGHSHTLPLPGDLVRQAMAVPTGAESAPAAPPPWISEVTDQAADKAAEKTRRILEEKYDRKFQQIDENQKTLSIQLKDVEKGQTTLIQQLNAQQQQIVELEKKVTENSKRPHPPSEAGSAFSRTTAGLGTASGEMEDKELVVAGGWSPNTPDVTMKKDITALLVKIKTDTGVQYTLVEFRCAEGFGEFCRFKLDVEGKTRVTTAWEVTSWLQNIKKNNQKVVTSASITGQSGGELWLVIHKPKAVREESSIVNTGLRSLHLMREELGYAENFYQLGDTRVQMVKGKFLGRSKVVVG